MDQEWILCVEPTGTLVLYKKSWSTQAQAWFTECCINFHM